ncbi:MAG TPA: Gfo/Idh/MocA family oxidoreductase [Bryobacteraceae bacterium]|nr:Gfo/Idh/MocA family oxidoreductase [Bryobacteraceae bacterium]
MNQSFEASNERKNSRREFLKSSAALLATAGYAYGSDAIRIGVIGCGGRGEAAAMNAMNAGKDIRLVAMGDLLADRVQEKRTALKLKYPGQVAVDDEHCFSGFDAYKHVIESADVVIVANAAKFHPLHLKTAVEAGKHVFLEKPHAIDPAGVKMVRAACALARQKGLSVVSGLQSRYHPGYRETMQRVHDGAIGDILVIQETWLRPPYVLYPRRPGQSEVVYQGSNQYHFHWLSGDDVPQTLIHNLDRARWALKEQTPARAYGMGGRSTLRGEIYGDVFDHNAVVYEFASGVRLYAYCRTIPNCYEENSSLLIGTKGRCDLLKLRITGETNWEHPGPKSKADAYDLEHVALFQSIRSGKPLNNGDYMADSTLTGVMGQLTCYTGKLVTWEQASSSDFYYAPRPEDVRADMEPPVKPGANGIYPVFVPGETKLL